MIEERIKFKKGYQRKFLNLVAIRLNCISIRGILQFGFDISYNSLKNYYTERRLIPKSLFENLCHVSHIDKNKIKYNVINGNWGQVLGGKISKR